MSISPLAVGERDFARMAGKFSALSEPMRLRILNVLMRGERNVGEITHAVGGTQTNISRHLQKLAHAGVLAFRKEGQCVLYHICDPTISQLCALVCKPGQVKNA